MSRFLGSFFAGLVAYWVAIGVGVVAWRDLPAGDATDIGAFTFAACYLLSQRERSE
jgi:hypothetical protein